MMVHMCMRMMVYEWCNVFCPDPTSPLLDKRREIGDMDSPVASPHVEQASDTTIGMVHCSKTYIQ